MLCRMAFVAQHDQVLFGVVAEVAAELLVMNFEMRPCTADLAAPAVTLQDDPVQFGVLRTI
jgi:hypothetical protein